MKTLKMIKNNRSIKKEVFKLLKVYRTYCLNTLMCNFLALCILSTNHHQYTRRCINEFDKGSNNNWLPVSYFFLKFIQVLEILNFFGYNILHFGSKIS